MRRESDDEFDDGASMASIETGRTNASEDGDFYDTYTKDDDDDAAVDEAIDELTEKRFVPLRASACGYGAISGAHDRLVCTARQRALQRSRS